MTPDLPSQPRHPEGLLSGEATLSDDPGKLGTHRLSAVLARCRTGLESYGARRAQWWRTRLAPARSAARQARSLAFGRKGIGRDNAGDGPD